ncbi:DUF7017 domain-containing protein [Exiguobacterium chiriqhucha]|uniref:Zorya protein ZorC EH domain-containing protein n=1 Tax=Exiguobacterium chiriqhucha RW-2 TaxID=1345023 RepID=U1LKK4_9BACL|nr:hypothetical protein [Exiguobacterium chiriqhucha]ERG68073.1 hypothetical protein M467_12355 [Exiguobacterium chiriqhucha RW-2]
MYTTKDYKDDLYQITKTRFVKYKLLLAFTEREVSQNDFIKQLKLKKEDSEIEQIFDDLRAIFEKVRLNGGKLDPDPVEEAKHLRKANKSKEAFIKILPALNNNPNDDDTLITFGWIMYDFLKISENEIDRYLKNFRILNDNATITLNRWQADDIKRTLVDSILWSIRRVILKDDSYADKVLPEFLRFYGSDSNFIETRYDPNARSASRSLIKDMMNHLNDYNYLKFTDTIGFDWFDSSDDREAHFQTEDGEDKKIPPLKESVLNHYAKRILKMDIHIVTEQRVNTFLSVLERSIATNTSFVWLPYHQGRLLLKLNRKEEALNVISSFGRTKSNEFWVWNLISELVDEEDRFNCLCAGLLCKTKPEMVVGLQEKIIPLLVQREMYSHAKRELDVLIKSQQANRKNVSSKLESWKQENWYSETESVDTRDQLAEYAQKAKDILYRTLPFTDIFITSVNEEKSIVNFNFLLNNKSVRSGYFHSDSIEGNHDWKREGVFKVKLFKHHSRPNFYSVHAVMQGDADFRSNFIQSEVGYVEKNDENAFAFVNDVFISPILVDKHELEGYDRIEFVKKMRFNKKKNTWGWSVDQITSVER